MTNIFISVYKNPIGRTFLGLIFAFIFGTSALFLSISHNEQLGDISVPYEIKETYKFENWVLNYDFLTLEYPDGGLVIPAYQNDRVAALLIIGEGSMRLESSDSFKQSSNHIFPLEDKVSEAIIPIHHGDFDRLKKDTIFIQEDINYPNDYLLERFESTRKLLFRGNIMGVEKIIPPTPRSVLVKLSSTQMGEINYKEDNIVLLSSDSLNYSFNHPINHINYPLPHTSSIMILYNIFLSLAFLGLIAFLTTDIEGKAYIKTGYLDFLPAMVHIIGFIGYSYLVKWLSITYDLESMVQIILYLIPVSYLIYCIFTSKVSIVFLGLTTSKILKTIIICVIIFCLWLLTATFGVLPTNSYDISSLFQTFVLIFLGQILIRGFIQSTLELLTGKWLGLVLSAIITLAFPLLSYVNHFYTTNWLLTISGYFAITLITSYSFQRTRSILAPTLLTLLFSLVIPHIF